MRWNVKPRFVLDGILNNVKDINDAILKTYGINGCFDDDFPNWKDQVEYKDGKTIVRIEVDRERKETT